MKFQKYWFGRLLCMKTVRCLAKESMNSSMFSGYSFLGNWLVVEERYGDEEISVEQSQYQRDFYGCRTVRLLNMLRDKTT